MRIFTTSLLVATLTLSACGTVRDSRLNPFNWFGRSQSQVVVADTREETNPLIPERNQGLFDNFRRQEIVIPTNPVDQISDLVIERVPGGAIVRASGITTHRGPFNVLLVPQTEDEVPVDGVLSYSLEAARPASAPQGGPERIRTVTAARHLTDNQLRNVRVIRVAGVRNARTSARR